MPGKTICMWSGPRNVSTAVMYSFAQRADTEVIDEPLYGYYLTRTSTEHPAEKVVVDAMDTSADSVIKDTIVKAPSRPFRFLKQMAHHSRELDLSFLSLTDNVLLTRSPDYVVASLRHQIPNPALADTAFDAQVRIVEHLEQNNQAACVVDSADLLANPEGMLKALCNKLNMPFDAAMLSWPAGPKPYDGVWAPWWYDNVHRSTGFAAPRNTPADVPAHLTDLVDQCQPLYRKLLQHRLTPQGS
ncbi:MAG: branched chain amino acid aminotransferase [Lysobacteraceae bacterium]|nr:MAG: branched chain amino acid aminotransferase [Xanthomonadaceae bacterium]